MELIVISSPVAVADESIIIHDLFQAGLKCLHIRKPDNDIRTLRELIRRIEPRFYNRISLHQFHGIANEFEIKRLHYTEKARNESNAEQWQLQIDQGYKLSSSIHQLDILPALKHFDYVFYGPVFDSLSKPAYQTKLPSGFKLTKSNDKLKIIALGGVEASNLIKIKAMNFDGAAVLGTLWNEPLKAINRFKQLKENLPV